ncbi:MAG: hypothetical protein RR348_01490 [Clostridia bacterium]
MNEEDLMIKEMLTDELIKMQISQVEKLQNNMPEKLWDIAMGFLSQSIAEKREKDKIEDLYVTDKYEIEPIFIENPFSQVELLVKDI